MSPVEYRAVRQEGIRLYLRQSQRGLLVDAQASCCNYRWGHDLVLKLFDGIRRFACSQSKLVNIRVDLCNT